MRGLISIVVILHIQCPSIGKVNLCHLGQGVWTVLALLRPIHINCFDVFVCIGGLDIFCGLQKGMSIIHNNFIEYLSALLPCLF